MNRIFSNQRLIWLLSLLIYLILVSIVIVIPPSNGYELAIIDAYPSAYWVLTVVLWLLPIAYLAVTSWIPDKLPYDKKTAVFLVAVSFFSLLLTLYLPIARGYSINGAGDTLTHLGMIKSIMTDGFVPDSHYPLLHVFCSMLSIISGISTDTITFHLIPILTTVFVLGFVCIANRLKIPHSAKISISALAVIPVVNFITQEGIMPTNAGWQLFPLFIFCVLLTVQHERKHDVTIVPAFILSVALWFIHPEVTIYLSAFLLVMLAISLYQTIVKKDNTHYSVLPIIILLSVSIIGYADFISQTGIFAQQLNAYYHSLFFGEMGEHSPVHALSSSAALHIKVLKFILLFGQIVSLFLIASLSILIAWKKRNQKLIQTETVLFVSVFIVFLCVALMMLFVGSGSGVHPYRQLKYPILFAILISGIYLIQIFTPKKGNKSSYLYSIISLVLIISLAVFSANTLYHNPAFCSNPNMQTKDYNIAGMEIYYNYLDGYPTVEPNLNQHQERYYRYLYGRTVSLPDGIRSTFDERIVVADSLGYDDYECFGDQYDEPTYFLKNPPLEGYKNLVENNIYYRLDITPIDYLHLDYDKTVNLIMTVGELEVYLSHP